MQFFSHDITSPALNATAATQLLQLQQMLQDNASILEVDKL